jgi:hypothetical protein
MKKTLLAVSHYFDNLINEAKMQKLIEETPAIVKARSSGILDIQVDSDRLYKKSRIITFKVTGSTGNPYKVVFYFKDRDNIWGEVKLFCNCKYTKYWGTNWNAKTDGYRLWKMGKDLPPDIRDPKRENKVCKHIIAAFKRLVAGEMSNKKYKSKGGSK